MISTEQGEAGYFPHIAVFRSGRGYIPHDYRVQCVLCTQCMEYIIHSLVVHLLII